MMKIETTNDDNDRSVVNMPLSTYDIGNIESIMAGHGDWFTARLLRLIAKADDGNRERIRLGFPDEVALFEKWQGQS